MQINLNVFKKKHYLNKINKNIKQIKYKIYITLLDAQNNS